MTSDPITAIAKAISSIADLTAKYLATREVRHMKAAIDAAERYIHINEGLGENSTLDEEEKKRLLDKLSKRFFKFN